MLFGFVGLLLCGISLANRPRWPGIAGLTIGLVCVATWGGIFWWGIGSSIRHAASFGLSVGQHTQMCMSALALAEVAESQRTSAGAAAPSIDLSSLGAEYRYDPWGRPYRYVVTSTPRGFTFMSDGPDGVSATPDDIDMFTIQPADAFGLPPISSGAAPNSLSAPTNGSPTGSGRTSPDRN